MANIEDRIVQMQFDNTAFERKMSTTITSLEKLNTTLANAGSRNGLTNISESVRNFHLGPMHAAIDGISAKFLAMSTIAITALSNIVNRAVDAGLRVASAFSFTPVTGGFQEYETQIGSIQTILANTSREGTNLTQVNAALDQLNEYSDKTIYNFSQMARNIGTFTAAGVDLETSVTSIQGIANLAAISGSNSEQASTAMYQLSQALATGSVKLMDWNSVVNAGMGGEVFQRALFDTGVAMGTIADAPIGTTFDEWTAAGNVFRTSLDEGWLSAEVLTTTLGALSGEATEASLMAQGFTQEMAQEMLALGELGIDAATKVRTMSQLMTTVKEAISSGWAQSFRLIFGNFEEATSLFTRISDSVGGFVSKNADARNALLQTWRDMGGRTKLLYAFGSGFKSLRIAMQPIKQAFREVFPPMTANRLVDITESFGRFMVAIRPGTQTMASMRGIFRGFFSTLKIGWTVLKEGIGFIANLFKSLTGAGSGGFLAFLGKIGESINTLRENLVDGGGIAEFFDGLTVSLQGPLAIIQSLKAKFASFINSLSNLSLPSGIGDFVNSIASAFSGLGGIGSGIGGNVGNIWDPLKSALGAVGGILESAWEGIKDFFSSLGDRIGGVFSGDAFSGVLDTIDTGLLVGIGLLLAKFLGGGLKLDFGGGIFSNISKSFEELTGVLSAMQTNLKATALLKIAGAIGILALSLALLATIEPEALSDALTAMAIGFAQLIGAFVILNQIGVGPKAAASMNLIGTSLILLAAAIMILVIAMKILATMSWEEIGKGLAGIAGALLLLVGAAFALSKVQGSLIRTGIGLMAVAIALGIMAGVVKLFSLMEWRDIGKGLAGVGGALVVLAAGMRLMPKGMLFQGAGLLLIGLALAEIAGVMKIFATMSWEEMGKGLVGVAGALIGIGIAVNLMPPTLPLIGAGLLLVGLALGEIVGVMMLLATMSWESIGKGLAGIAGALLAISLAMVIASGSIGGAIGITIMAYAIKILADVLEQVGNLSWDVIIHGLVGIGAAIGLLALASILLAPALPAMLGLGVALLLISAAFAVFGVGVMAVAKGFEILAKVGKAGAQALTDAMKALAKNLPDFLKGIAEGILELVQTILDGLPAIIEMLVAVLSAILDGLIELIPKAVEAITILVQELLKAVRTLFPDIVTTGFDLIKAFLSGIRDNIGEIVVLVADIITNFLDALALKIPEVIDSMYNFLIAVIEGVVEKLVDVGDLLVPKGLELLRGLIKGIDDNKEEIFTFFRELPGKIVDVLGDIASFLLEKGGQLLSGLYNGASSFVTGTMIPWLAALPGQIFSWIGDTAPTLAVRGKNLIVGFINAAIGFVNSDLIPWVGSLAGKIWRWIGNTALTLVSRGKNLIVGFINAAISFVNSDLVPWLASLPGKIWHWIGDTLPTLASRGKNLIIGFFNAVIGFMNSDAIPWFVDLAAKVWHWVGDTIETLAGRGKNLMIGFINGVVGYVNSDIIPWFADLGGKVLSYINDLSSTLWSVGSSLMTGLWNGIKAVWDNIWEWVGNKIESLPGFVKSLLGIDSPSKVFKEIGMHTMQGFHVGLIDGWKATESWISKLDPGKPILQGPLGRMKNALAQVSDSLGDMDEFNPTITPVLDLTRIQEEAKMIAGMLPATSSYAQASRIAASTLFGEVASTAPDDLSGRDIKFEQNNYSPKALTTGDVYRNTRNQLAMAKERLEIP